MKPKGYLKIYLTLLLIATLTLQLIPSLTFGQITASAAKSSDDKDKDKDKKKEEKGVLKGKRKKNKKEKPYSEEHILVKKKDKDKDKNDDQSIGFGWYKRKLKAGEDVIEEIKKYKKEKVDSNVINAAPDFIVNTTAIPNDGSYINQWALNNVNDSDIDAPEAWNTRTDASDVVVAVIDSGVNYKHEDLAANMWKNPGEIANNGIDDDNNGYVDDVYGINAIEDTGDPMEYAEAPEEVIGVGHGTHVAGTIGAVGNNGVGVTGVAWKVKIMALKFIRYNDGYTSDAIQCIDYAINKGAHIMSNSWGGASYDAALQDAIQAARNAGIIFVAAAGNDGEGDRANTDLTPHYPSSYKVDNIVSVASTNVDNNISTFSSYGGGSVDIAAPGQDILSTGFDPVNPTNNSFYRTLSGTSMATPHVSGALALLKAQFPSENYLQLLNRLYSSTDPMSALVGKCRTEGRLNLQKLLQTTSSKPANDAFQNAKVISSNENLFVSGINTDATKASGEPNHGGNAGGKSVWWTWTAPKNGIVKISTKNSSFDTLLGVYTGTSITALTSIASNNNSSTTDLSSSVKFNAVAGTTYRIAVDGVNGASGGIELSIGYPPINDNFVDAIAVNTGTYTGKNFGASLEPGETPYGSSFGYTVWWKFTPTVSEEVIISTLGSSFSTVLAVYTGSSVNNLSLVAGDDYYNYGGGLETGSLVGFKTTANTTYYIAVDGYNDTSDGSSGGGVGDIALSISFNKAPTINAGVDQTVQISGTTYLNADATDDGLPTSPGYLIANWSLVNGPAGGNVVFNNYTSFRTTAYFTKTGVYTLQLHVTDGAASTTDTLKVTVNPNSTTSQTLSLEDLEDNTANGWTPASGTWSVGNIVSNWTKTYNSKYTDSVARTVVGQSTWSNYSISSKVFMGASGGGTYGLGLLARYKDNNNYYMFVYEGYKLRIKKKVNGTITELAYKDFSDLNFSQWYTLEAIVDGNNLRLFLNGELMLGVSDSSLSTGKAGLISFYVDGSFDDVVVSGARITERFSSTTVPFTAAGGTWGVASGKYQVTTPSTASTLHLNTRSLHNTSVSGDFTLMVDASTVSTSNTWNDFAVIFGYKDTNNYYFASFNESNDPNTHGIFKVSNGVSTQLENFGATITPGTTYKVDIRRTGNLIEVYLDGQFYGEAEDSTFINGKVGFGSKNDKAIFDNLVIY
jgi:subtilisin family serine protease